VEFQALTGHPRAAQLMAIAVVLVEGLPNAPVTNGTPAVATASAITVARVTALVLRICSMQITIL
jgi:hypothetical protein